MANQYFKAFVYGVGISFLFFIPFIIYDKRYFLFYGDFNVQQLPFYQMAHDAVSGSFGWSWITDLGANFYWFLFIFYLLGSPFFWLTIPFSQCSCSHLIGNCSHFKVWLCLLNRLCLFKTIRSKPKFCRYRRHVICLFGILRLQYLF